jgi:apolipoprotein N-acyltransferase
LNARGPAVGRRTALALAAGAGGAWALAAPPRGWWPLLPLGAGLLAIALAGLDLRSRLGLGAVTGLALYGTTLPWLTDFSPPGYVIMVALQTGLLAGAAALAVRWWALPGALVLLEAAQSRFPLGGFPLPGLAHSQPDGPFVLAAPLGGALLVTGLAVAAGVAAAALVLVRGMRRRVAASAAALVATLLPLGVGAAVSTTPAGALDAAVVQGGGPRGTRAVFTDPADVTARHLAVLDTVSGSPDLVLLPEGVVVVDAPLARTTDSGRLSERARQLSSVLVVGVVEGEPDGFRNAAVAYAPDGRLVDRYEKEHRVPFGEYIPARNLLSKFTDATALVPKDAIVGRGTARLQLPRTVAGVVISFEVFFADRVREAVGGGGQLVLVPTNASSYVGEEVPAIELAAARLRAREFGRAVLQAAPTGYSAIVLPDGRVSARSELGAPALLRERVPLRTGLTPFARLGDAPVLALAAALILLATSPRLLARRWSGR